MSARGDSAIARQSIRELCDRYYHPVYAFVRSYTNNDENARDWTHSFFAQLLEGQSLDNVLPSRGRFRTYLLGAVKHFLTDERRRLTAQKRGGGIDHQSTDLIANDLLTSPSASMPNDAYFDRHWALSILELGFHQLKQECVGPGTTRLFEAVQPWLIGDPVETTQEEVARQLSVSRDVVKKSLQRWRVRFREIIKALIADTVETPQEVDQELAYLIESLASSKPE